MLLTVLSAWWSQHTLRNYSLEAEAKANGATEGMERQWGAILGG